MRGYALLLAMTGAITVLAPDAAALEVGLTLTQESEYTTNTALTERDEIEEWIHSPRADLTLTHAGPTLSADISYGFIKNFYQEDVYDDDDEAAGTASLVWNALPERLDFNIDHTRTQTAIRSIGAITPDNRQEIVNTTAGPVLRFNPRAQDEILFEYLYGDRSTTVTDTNATTHDISARYVLAFSPISTLTFAAINNHVQWENPADPDIEYNIAQLTWDRETPDFNYSLTGGYNRTERTLGRDDITDFVYDIGAEWQVRPGTLITFLAARDIRDQTYNLTSGLFASDLDFSASSGSAEVFTSERFGVGISQRIGGRTTLDFSGVTNEEDFEEGTADDDNEGYHLQLELSRQLSPRLDLSFAVAYDPLEYPDLDREETTLRGSMSLDFDWGRRLSLGVGVGYEERESDSLLGTTEYDEWSAMFRVSYEVVQLNR